MLLELDLFQELSNEDELRSDIVKDEVRVHFKAFLKDVGGTY